MDRSLLETFGRRVRVGMVGGGADSVIGRTHLIAMRADGVCELVAGAMSVDPKIAAASGRQELLAPDRIYTDWREMADKEAARTDRIDVVVIATPPRLHFPVAKAFLERGIDVLCEKPMTHDLAEAKALAAEVKRSGRLFCLGLALPA
jgi:predicted dehydrogenase